MHALLSRIADPLVLAGIILVAGFLSTRLAFREKPIGQFLCQLITIAGFTAMLIVARVIPFKPTAITDWTITTIVISVFKIIWWLAAAWLLAGFVRALLVFKRRPVETRFLQDLFAGFIYAGAVLAIIAYVFDIPVSGLLAASGVIAIVLGLALQSTLGDFFSGVVLNFAKPFHPGDWIIIDAGLEGRVVETNWRATQILTLADDLAVVPNSVIAKARLVNASKPTQTHIVSLIVRLDPTTAPSTSVAVLARAMLSCDHILRTPVATVTARLLDASALECELRFAVAAIEQAPEAQNDVYDKVFRHCASAGIRLAPPASSGFALPPRGPPPDPNDVPRRLLERLSVFVPLSHDERIALAPKMQRRCYDAGDILIAQGVVAQALFVLHSGVLAALQQHAGGAVELFRMAPGDCFAEASMLTGAPTMFEVKALTRAVAYEIAQADLAPLLKARPAIAAELSQIMANRQAAGKVRLAELDDDDKHSETLAERLAGRIKLVFGL